MTQELRVRQAVFRRLMHNQYHIRSAAGRGVIITVGHRALGLRVLHFSLTA